jgi:hypothetical protein
VISCCISASQLDWVGTSRSLKRFEQFSAICTCNMTAPLRIRIIHVGKLQMYCSFTARGLLPTLSLSFGSRSVHVSMLEEVQRDAGQTDG